MKTQIWVYVVVGLLSIGAGVAIAGLPNTEPREPTIQPPTTTETTVSVLDSEDSESLFRPSSDPVGTDASSGTDAATTSAPTADDSEGTDGTAGGDIETTDSTTTSTTTTTTTEAPLPDRAVIDVVVANGAGSAGVASGVASLLEAAGYVDVRSLDGSEVVDESVVYAGPGLEAFAMRLAEDVDLGPESVLPLDEMPDVSDMGREQLVVYLGRDVLGQ